MMDDGATGRVPQACTLPTVERPLRVTEWAAFLARVSLLRHESGHVLLDVPAELAGATADLAARESACCSFFTFTLTVADGRIRLDVVVDPAHADVLDAMAAQVRAGPAGAT